MKKIKGLIAVLLAGMSLTYVACNSNQSAPVQQYPVQNNVTVAPPAPVQQTAPQNVSIQPVANIPTGFNVDNFATLLRTTTNADALTQAINNPANAVNTLDLDGDGNTDYLRVNQIDNNTLQVVDEVGSNTSDRTLIATLTLNTVNNSYAINGAPEYCGPTYVYQSPSGLTWGQIAFLSWWFTPYHMHHVYHPYWGYHTHYYSGYHPYHGRTLYTRKEVTTYREVRRQAPATRQASAPRQVAPAPAPRNIPNVSNPTVSQKAFKAGESDRYKAAVGNNNAFKPQPVSKPTPAPTPVSRPSAPSRSSSFGSSSSSRSSSFGSSRSSFGSSSRSSSSGRRR